MQNNQNTIYVPTLGMDRDTHPVRLKDGTYTFAKNISVEDSSGNGLPMVQNEPSTIFCKEFKSGKNIIGFKYEPSLRKTFLFIADTITGFSEIGYISHDVYSYGENGEVEFCNCEPKIELGKKLEDLLDFTEICSYTKLVGDECEEANKCLNLSINHPIKPLNIIFKNEQCGKRLYWTDGYNPPRYIHLEELEEGAEGELWKTNRYFHKGSLVCKQELDLIQTCLNCDALKIFPEFSIPCLSVETITSGGSLYEGTYEFFIAFCDEDGNEISSYYSHTFPTPIFNFDDLIVDSLDLSRPTTFGINLQVEYLDTNFSYYKIACVFRSALNQSESYVDLGVFPITQTSIMVTSLTSGNPITINRILTTKNSISVVDKMSEANGHLFLGGFTAKPSMNLQPIVNLIGPFAKWNTLIAKEDFYKDPINSQKFRQYMRDEGYALSICFGIDDGTETNDFPLINRAAFTTEDYERLGVFGREDDLQILVNNSGELPVPTTNDLNVRSILNGSKACLDSNRIYRFQYYNTAANKGLAANDSVDTTIDFNDTSNLIKRTSTSFCSTIELNDLNLIPTLNLRVDGAFQFYQGTLAEFISTLISEYRNPSYEFYSPEFATYLQLSRYAGLGCFYNLGANSTNCNNFNLIAELLRIEDVIQITMLPTFIEFINYEYKELGYIETQFASGVRAPDVQLSNKLGLKGYPQIQLRVDLKVGPDCNKKVSTLRLDKADIESSNGYIFKNLGAFESTYTTDLLWDNYQASTISDTVNYPMTPLWASGEGVTKFPTPADAPDIYTALETWKQVRVSQQFSAKIAKNAIWFTLNDLNEYPYLQLNFNTLESVEIEGNDISSQFNISEATDVTLNRIKKIRLSIFDTCSSGGIKSALTTLFFSTSDKPLLDIRTLISNLGLDVTKNYILAVDSPIQNVTRSTIRFKRGFDESASFILDAPTPEELRFIEYFESGGIAYYRARGVANNNQPKTNCFGEAGGEAYDQYSPIAWAEDGDYSPTCGGGRIFVPEVVSTSDLWTTTTLDKSFMVVQRGKEVDFYDANLENIVIEKEQTYSQDCYYKDISQELCGYGNYENGLFAYHESLETYPDNSDLYDASKLSTKISESLVDTSINKVVGEDDFDIFPGISFKDIFKINFGTQTSFVNDDKIDFSCKPIRHFKFPDNVISPFINTTENIKYGEAYIHPLGLNISTDVVNVFLNLAVETGQITQQQRDSIIYFKVKRGFRGSNRTVLSKGFLSDMIQYSNLEGGENYYSNFPFNSLNNKELILQGKNPIKHQNKKLGNNRFSFISPEILRNTNLTPTELKVDGYVYGDGVKQVDEVQDHEKMVVLTESSKDLAKALGTAEAIFELGMKTADLLVVGANSMWAIAGVSTGGNYGQFVAWGAIALGIAFQASEFSRKSWEYEYKWLEAFKTAGKGANFAHYIAGVGTFNNFTPFKEDSFFALRDIRKLKLIEDGNYKINQDGGTLTTLNHNDREKSMYLYLGPAYKTDGLIYPQQFIGLDDSNYEPTQESLRTEEEFKVANLYGALKVYSPSQYGRLHNVTWVDTPGCFYLKDTGSNLIFGGDTYISRITYKKKYNYYLASALNHVDFKPVKYSRLDTLGKNKYFIDYDTEATGIGNYGLPFSDSIYNLQFVKEQGKYVTEGRFYHYEYGIHNQLVESEINGWTRVALKQPKDNFYPNYSDYMSLTQENFVSIRERETFLFNTVYSNDGVKFNGKFLPDNFDPKFYNCINNSPSGIAYSQPDKSEKKKVDPWLIFKPLDFYNFKAAYGKFISLKSIESQQLLALFEHKLVLLNRIDEIRERITPETSELGTGSIFQSRPMEFHSADSGYGGAQHGEILSTEFGHFYVDARRGQIFQVGPNADKMEEITDGLRNWFKEHLPFKILRGSIEGLTDLDLDNNFKGLGLTLGWDPRYKRVFLTKLDYTIKPNFRGLLEYRKISNDNDLVETKVLVNKTTGLEVQLSNTDIFTPCHFTLSYSPLLKTWMSYYSFYPNFYITYDNYFRTGVNENNNLGNIKVKKTGLWSHLLTNKSFGVFYGTRYPWSIEINSKEQFNQKLLTNVNFWVDSIRYHNDYDYSQNTELGLDSAIFYNNTNNSGKLNFVNREPNNRFQYTQYPKYNTDGSSDILVAFDEGSWKVNDFYNRTINQNNNVPIWNFDLNAIDKTINPQAITFKSSWLDRMRGDYFLTRFEGGSDSRYKQIFKWGIINEDIVI